VRQAIASFALRHPGFPQGKQTRSDTTTSPPQPPAPQSAVANAVSLALSEQHWPCGFATRQHAAGGGSCPNTPSQAPRPLLEASQLPGRLPGAAHLAGLSQSRSFWGWNVS